jgi:pantothenate kinase
LPSIPPFKRLLVGLAGLPASGKSRYSDLLLKHISDNLQRRGSDSRAKLIGLDGWHLTRAQLDQFDDPKLAHWRRGAHWTFDGTAYLMFVKALRTDITSTSPTLTAPSFDHAVKDPSPDAVTIYPEDRIVVIEGLYTLLTIDPWKEAASLMDERWYIQVPTETAIERLAKRHVQSGICNTLEEGYERAKGNDMPSK